MDTVPFSFQAVIDGHWEFYHDDDCGAVLDPDTKVCSACGWRPDLQSMGARRVAQRTVGESLSLKIRKALGDFRRNGPHYPNLIRVHPAQQMMLDNEGLAVSFMDKVSNGAERTIAGIPISTDLNVPVDELWFQQGTSKIGSLTGLEVPEGYASHSSPNR